MIPGKFYDRDKKDRWYISLYWWIYRSIRDNYRLDRKIKWFYQRRVRGFDDMELWNLNFPLSRHILPRLKAFRNLPLNGYPSNLISEDNICEYTDERDFEIWLSILDKMILAFEYILKEDDDLESGIKSCWNDEDGKITFEKDEEQWKKFTDELNRRQKVIEEGLGLFAKHFQNLWD